MFNDLSTNIYGTSFTDIFNFLVSMQTTATPNLPHFLLFLMEIIIKHSLKSS